MYPQDRKLQQRITRRMEKVRKLIQEQEDRLANLEPENYERHQDYLHVLSQYNNKLQRLKQELLALEAGKLPGSWL